MLNALLILALFGAAAVLMFLRKVPAVLALPLMAIGIGLIEVFSGNLTLSDVSLAIMADGSIRLAEPMVISFFGGMVSVLLQKSGIAESLVRRGAELAGDNPLLTSVLLLAIVTILFSTIGGLGAVIMVGTIMLPILSSLGLREYLAAGILLVGISLGGLLNANNWAVYKSVLGMQEPEVFTYALSLFGITSVGAIAFVAVELIRTGSVGIRRVRSSLIGIIAVAALSGWLIYLAQGIDLAPVVVVARWVVGLSMAVIVVRRLIAYRSASSGTPLTDWTGYLIPLVPLVCILLYGMPFITAFVVALVYGVVVTLRRGSLNMLSRAIIEGSSGVIPAIVLMLGIGMLLSAILGPSAAGPGRDWYIGSGGAPWPVLSDMRPLLELIVPGSFVSYVVIFSLLGPLALYRGPMNVWGLGYGVGGILLATGVPAGAIMGVLMSLGIIQGISDPTNTQNVWVANEVRIDVNEIMRRTLPYSWAIAIVGLVVAGLLYYSS